MAGSLLTACRATQQPVGAEELPVLTTTLSQLFENESDTSASDQLVCSAETAVCTLLRSNTLAGQPEGARAGRSTD